MEEGEEGWRRRGEVEGGRVGRGGRGGGGGGGEGQSEREGGMHPWVDVDI